MRIQTLDARPRVLTEEVMGTVRAVRKADLEARLNARIERLPVVLGQKVGRGELLVQLDNSDVSARLTRAEAVLEQANRDFERFKSLLAREAVTQSQFDDIQSKRRVAKAQVEEAGSMLSHATIEAPFDGVITRKLADVGDQALPGKTLLTLEDPGLLQFEAAVPGALIDSIKPDAKLSIHVAGRTNSIEGRVTEIAPAAETMSRTFLVKVELPGIADLRSGSFGRLAVPIGETRGLRAPVSAVLKRGQMELTFVVRDNTAHLRLIKTGRQVGDELEILSGIEPGESVVIEGASNLTDGQPISTQ